MENVDATPFNVSRNSPIIMFSSCPNTRKLRIVILLSAMTLLVSCSSIKSSGERLSATGIDAGDMIVIVPNLMADTDDDFESSLAACIQEELKNLNTNSRYVPYHDFRSAIFGDLKQPDLPLCNDIIKLASDDSKIKSKIEALDIRYLVCVSGGSYSSPPEASGVSGYGGGLLILYWKKSSTAEAKVYDLRKLLCAGSLTSRAEDTGAVGILPPLFIPAITESRACKQLGTEVSLFLTNKEK
jgi:hypothetical protein